jgi:ArsR family transcriptional regulator
VSHHLKVLTQAGILEREQRGTWAWFSVNGDRLSTIAQLFG